MEERKEHFTPGPWESKGRTICPKNQLDPLNTEIVCRIHENRFASREEANAALIVVAPLVRGPVRSRGEVWHKTGGPWNVPGEPGTWIAKAKEALRKARGERNERTVASD